MNASCLYLDKELFLNTSVLISNLALSIDSSMLEDMFSAIGHVRKVVIQTDEATGLSRGFGLVEMSSPEEARDCVLHFDGQRKDGQILIVREEKSRGTKRIAFETVIRQPGLRKAIRSAARKVNGDGK
ncbi:MAG: RNA-binding protein [Bdellovibrionaceae bacterium]|nr:RNA-binding protein [Pseudobdellovibrionaceae bacterium]